MRRTTVTARPLAISLNLSYAFLYCILECKETTTITTIIYTVIYLNRLVLISRPNLPEYILAVFENIYILEDRIIRVDQ